MAPDATEGMTDTSEYTNTQQADDFLQTSSAARGDIVAALAKAQGEFDHAARDKANPHFGSTYANLSSLLDAVRAPLTKHGIALTFPTVKRDGGDWAAAKILHGEQWLQSWCPLEKQKPGSQGYGSALTYAKRQAVGALLAIADKEDKSDDDGEASQCRTDVDEAKKETAAVKRELRDVRSQSAALVLRLQKEAMAECGACDDVDGLREIVKRTKRLLGVDDSAGVVAACAKRAEGLQAREQPHVEYDAEQPAMREPGDDG